MSMHDVYIEQRYQPNLCGTSFIMSLNARRLVTITKELHLGLVNKRLK